MRIYYDHSVVTGYKHEDGKKTKEIREDLVHLRHMDPIRLAARRNIEMAGCDTFKVDRTPAFSRWVDEEPSVRRNEIMKMNSPEYD